MFTRIDHRLHGSGRAILIDTEQGRRNTDAGTRSHAQLAIDRDVQGISHGPAHESVRASVRLRRVTVARRLGSSNTVWVCCVSAADASGTKVISITARVAQAMTEVSDGSLETVLRAVSRAYLDTCAQEPDHTRAWVLELAAAGPEGVEARTRYLDGFAELMREIDCRYGSRRPRPAEHYIALVGGITELVGREVRAGAQAALPHLEDALTDAGVAMLR